MNGFPEGICDTCQTKTRLRCHCHKWGYEELYFCSADCKRDHLQDHKFMTMKRPTKEVPEDEAKRPNIVLSSFSKETCGGKLSSEPEKSSSKPEESCRKPEKSSNRLEESGGSSKGFRQPMKTSNVNLDESQEDEDDAGEIKDQVDVPSKKDPNDGDKETKDQEEGNGDRRKMGPLLAISRLSKLQKTRKTNTYLKLLKLSVLEMQLFKPRWKFQLKTVSTDEDVKIKKKAMNFTFQRVEDMKQNNINSNVKRRWTTSVKCIKALEALRPDLIFDLSTDKPQGTGMQKAHQYRSPEDRPSVDVIEEPQDDKDDIDTDIQVAEEENDDKESADGDRAEEGFQSECRICKEPAFEEGGEVMLYCGTNKKVAKHYGCHITCIGLVRIKVGDKILNDIKSHYRCPDHMD